jgi:hypothetical protein
MRDGDDSVIAGEPPLHRSIGPPGLVLSGASAVQVIQLTEGARMTFAELRALLADSRREHYHCDDSWYCCGKCDHPDHDGEFPSSHDGEARRTAGVCNCGADAWNARVDAALAMD